jgi:asparagine synthase (glutamine-hydrolysing)
MCGIAGIFDMGAERPLAAAELDAMLAAMPHRGPDARGAAVLNPLTGLGHLRLAILDLVPESNQPFEVDEGACVVTFNGEIYNYLELRRELETLGHRFRTRSDTEVLLRAYLQWGGAAVNRFNGMWAFAIYDRRRDTLFCSRDRFGVKPFLYTRHRGRFLFASEAKAILAVAPELARPNYAALSHLLRASQGGRLRQTCFEGIERLPPAHNLLVTRDDMRLERYWEYPTDVHHDITPQEAAAGLRQHLCRALELRMRSDVPVGTTLSSGIDSSALVCLLRTFYDQPHETFTASYEGEWFDESPTALALSRSLGMSPNLLPAYEADFLDTLRSVMWHLEAPVYNPAVVPLWSIMKRARTKVTVVLEGQGADELLAGYDRGCFTAAAVDGMLRGDLRGARSAYARYVRVRGWRSAILFTGRNLAPFAHGAARWLRGDERVYAGPLRDVALNGSAPRRPRAQGMLNRLLLRQHEGVLADLLHYGDAISMAHSIESRLPYMDYRLVEFAFRLPGWIKYRDGWPKAVLRDAVRDVVPEAIVNQEYKAGFPTPIHRWFRERPDLTVDPVLRSRACRERGLFDPKALDRALRAHASGRLDLSNHIFRWIMTELWFQQFIDGAATPRAGSGDGVATPGVGSGDGAATPGAGSGDGAATPGAGSGDGAATPGAGSGDGAATPRAGSGDGAATPGAGSGDGVATPRAGSGDGVATPRAGSGDGAATPRAGSGDGAATPRAGSGDGAATPGAGSGDGLATPGAGSGDGVATPPPAAHAR